MKGVIGIQPGKPSSDSLLPGFHRFDQKNNMIFAGDWNAVYPGCSEAEFLANRIKHAQRGAYGFRREDWGYYLAAFTNQASTHFRINVSDCGGTLWNPFPANQLPVEPGTLPAFESSPEKNTRLLKGMAARFGAGDSGVCLLDRNHIYSHYYVPEEKKSFPIRFSDEPGIEPVDAPTTLPDRTKVIPAAMRYVLVLVFPMELVGVNAAPTLTHMATTQVSYSQIALTVMALAEFIRGLGYNALPSSNDLGPNIPMAIDAGLGESTRNAKLAHPVYGTCCRLAKIVTDLPLVPDAPIQFGVHQFCRICKRCAQNCPSKAISMDDDMSDQPRGAFSNANVRQWQMDHDKCRRQWIRVGTNCGICIASCPLNRKNTLGHRLKKSLMASVPACNRLLLKSWSKGELAMRKMGREFWNHV